MDNTPWQAGADALDHRIAVIGPVFRRNGASAAAALAKAQHRVATMDGALILARIRQSARPILDIAAAYREA